MDVLVGGVGELFQGDLDVGRRAVQRLAAEDLGADVLVEDLCYGAVAVVLRLQELRPRALVLVAAVQRGRAPGAVEVRAVAPSARSAAELQAAVGDAATGYVTLDLLVDVATALHALPGEVVAVEVEPASTGPSEELSPLGAAALEQAVGLARVQARRLAGATTRPGGAT